MGKLGQIVRSLLLTALGSALHAASVDVTDPYIRLVPPVSRNSAAYMVLTNKEKSSIRLTGVECEVAERVELHGHKIESESMRMFALDSIDIPANGSHALASGTDHIMLLGLKRVLVSGERIDLTLIFSDGDSTHLNVPVREESTAACDQHH